MRKSGNWQDAIDLELDTLRSNCTWIATEKPASAKPLHYKWVFKTKLDSDGGVERFKARLVACGNEQQAGINYNDTFAPVLDQATARMILALSVIWHCPARHGDIPAAYTKAAIESDSDIYMYPPNGMVLTEDERIAGGLTPGLKLQRSLYGLKQAGRIWNNLLHAQLLDIGYTRCKTDLCLYFKRKECDIAIVDVYVDDLLASATSPQLVEDLFTSLKSIEVKDLGVVRKYLGMCIEFKADGFTLDQETLVREYVEAHTLANINPLTTPTMLHQDPGGKEPLNAFETKEFCTLAGGLLWLARCTCPDIAFAVHQMTRRTHARAPNCLSAPWQTSAPIPCWYSYYEAAR
jgi:hypothetical protein